MIQTTTMWVSYLNINIIMHTYASRLFLLFVENKEMTRFKCTHLTETHINLLTYLEFHIPTIDCHIAYFIALTIIFVSLWHLALYLRLLQCMSYRLNSPCSIHVHVIALIQSFTHTSIHVNYFDFVLDSILVPSTFSPSLAIISIPNLALASM